MRKLPGPILRRACRETARALLDLCVPQTCASCGGPTREPLCAACRSRLERRDGPRCRRCGEALLHADSACVADHAWLRWIWFLCAPWRYRGAGGAVVRRFKFEGDPAAGGLLVEVMANALSDFVRGAGRRALVVHVPMHRRRRRARGFDQAERLASGVADRLGLEFGSGVLRRRRETLTQTDPRVTSRQTNVEGAFDLRRPRIVRGRMVVLVDDVVTSGATARACAAVLRANGARRVVLLTATVG
ncbi:MAG: phosphoribosyltransferase family protein [Planctomycetota bacterium]